MSNGFAYYVHNEKWMRLSQDVLLAGDVTDEELNPIHKFLGFSEFEDGTSYMDKQTGYIELAVYTSPETRMGYTPVRGYDELEADFLIIWQFTTEETFIFARDLPDLFYVIEKIIKYRTMLDTYEYPDSRM